jgi:hypothetical protein
MALLPLSSDTRAFSEHDAATSDTSWVVGFQGSLSIELFKPLSFRYLYRQCVFEGYPESIDQHFIPSVAKDTVLRLDALAQHIYPQVIHIYPALVPVERSLA